MVRAVVVADGVSERELVEGEHRWRLRFAVEQHQRLGKRLDVGPRVAVDLFLPLSFPPRVRVGPVRACDFPQFLAVDEKPPFERRVQGAAAAGLVQRGRYHAFAGRGIPFPVFPV